MKQFTLRVFIVLTGIFFVSQNVFSQITVTTGIPPATLVQNVLVGSGVTVSNVSYTGHPNAIGQFQTGATPSNLGISEGIVISTGIVNDSWAPIGSPYSNHASTDNGYSGNSLLTSLAGYTTYDAAILQFDFVPLSDTIKFRYVFGSEEYHEYVNSGFNDVFAFFITGPNPLGGNYTNYNIARIPGTSTVVSIDNVNNGNHYTDCASGPCTNCAYFVDNCYGNTVVYDAFTVVLTAWAKVVPCQTYQLKIGIADAGDGILDSGVFLEAGSLVTDAVSITTSVSLPTAGTNAIEGCNNVTVLFELPAPAQSNRVVPFTIGGTATNGVDYTAIPNSVTIPAGQTSASLTIVPLLDGIPEGPETVILDIQTSPCTNEIITVTIVDYDPVLASGFGSTDICAGGGPVNIGVNASNGAPSYTYTWSHGLPSSANHSVNPVSNTTYTITVTDACGYSATASVTVNVSDDIILNITPSSPEICLNNSQLLTVSGANNYLWSTGATTPAITVSPATTTTYSVTGSDNSGCTGSAEVIVTVHPHLNISISPAEPGVCIGEQIVLTAENSATGPSYLWNTGQTTQSVSVSPVTPTNYSVFVSDAYGCTGSADVFVEVFPIPDVGFTAEPLSGCSPLKVTFTNLSDSGSYIWQFGNGAVSSLTNPVYQYASSGRFTVSLKVTSGNGCSNTLVRPEYIHVVPSPVADFIAKPPFAYEDNPLIQFFDQSVGANAWSWKFGDGNFSSDQNPEHSYEAPGKYLVELYVENTDGCGDSTDKYVVIRPEETFYIPNAFSPNGDGVNDFFMPFGNGIDSDDFEMLIFDRWGKMVFKSVNLNTPWDGTSTESDKILPQGVYVYKIRINFYGIVSYYEGTVTLVE